MGRSIAKTEITLQRLERICKMAAREGAALGAIVAENLSLGHTEANRPDTAKVVGFDYCSRCGLVKPRTGWRNPCNGPSRLRPMEKPGDLRQTDGRLTATEESDAADR